MIKKLILFIAVLLFTSCSQKDKGPSLYPYHLTINSLDYNPISSEFEPQLKIDTIMAADDTVAFQKAYITFASSVYTDQTLQSKVSKTVSFIVKDSIGIDLSARLPYRVTDSIKNMVDTVLNKELKQHNLRKEHETSK